MQEQQQMQLVGAAGQGIAQGAGQAAGQATQQMAQQLLNKSWLVEGLRFKEVPQYDKQIYSIL